MSRSCHNALTARHEPSFSASFSTRRPPGRSSCRAAARNDGQVSRAIKHSTSATMTQSNAAGRSAASVSIVQARNSACGFLPTDSFAHAILRTSGSMPTTRRSGWPSSSSAARTPWPQPTSSRSVPDACAATCSRGASFSRRVTKPALFRGQRVEDFETGVGHGRTIARYPQGSIRRGAPRWYEHCSALEQGAIARG